MDDKHDQPSRDGAVDETTDVAEKPRRKRSVKYLAAGFGGLAGRLGRLADARFVLRGAYCRRPDF